MAAGRETQNPGNGEAGAAAGTPEARPAPPEAVAAAAQDFSQEGVAARLVRLAGEGALDPGSLDRVRTRSGVELRLGSLSVELYNQIIDTGTRRHPVPEVPKVEVRNRNETWNEENPDDPDYQAAVNRADIERGNFITDALLTFGVETEPDERFLRRARRFGLELPEDPDDLKLHWLRQHVLAADADASLVLTALLGRFLPREEQIRAAARELKSDRPRNRAERRARRSQPRKRGAKV